jgi:hypothetical protein
MTLIGAPVIVNLASYAVPVDQSEPQSGPEVAPAQNLVVQAPASRPAPPPITSSQDAMAQPVDAAVNAVAPLLDTRGIEPTPAGDVTSFATQLSNVAPPPGH